VRSLVTGGAGLIGSHLTERLLAQGDEVTVLDDLSTGRWENLRAVADCPRLRAVQGSIFDGALLRELATGCDQVFHLAAAVGVQMIVERPVQTIEITSSSEVYGKSADVPFREDGDMVFGPTTVTRWSYACSKAIDEFLALAYAREYGLPVVVARLFNTVGSRQIGRYGMVIPRLVQQCRDGGPMVVHGDGAQTRCFAAAEDVAAILVRLLALPEAHGRIFNVGHDEEHSILDLAERVRRRIDPGCAIRRIPYDEAYGPGFEDLRRRVPDLSRLRALLGPLPMRGLDEILDGVIAAAPD